MRLKVQMVAAKIKSDAMSGTADILKWWTFMATDVSAHLMFGESFNMIERGEVSSNNGLTPVKDSIAEISFAAD